MLQPRSLLNPSQSERLTFLIIGLYHSKVQELDQLFYLCVYLWRVTRDRIVCVNDESIFATNYLLNQHRHADGIMINLCFLVTDISTLVPLWCPDLCRCECQGSTWFLSYNTNRQRDFYLLYRHPWSVPASFISKIRYFFTSQFVDQLIFLPKSSNRNMWCI